MNMCSHLDYLTHKMKQEMVMTMVEDVKKLLGRKMLEPKRRTEPEYRPSDCHNNIKWNI